MGLSELLSNKRIFGNGLSIALDRCRPRDQRVTVAFEHHVQGGSQVGTFVSKRSQCHAPALVDFAKNIRRGDTYVRKKHFIEFRIPRHHLQWPNGNAWACHVDQQTGKALMFGRSGIRADDQ